MSVKREEVLRAAQLAEIAVPPEDVDQLVADMARIVDYVSQLGSVPDAAVDRFVPGPPKTPLRRDAVDPIPLARPPEATAPEYVDGFFVVPKLGAMGGE